MPASYSDYRDEYLDFTGMDRATGIRGWIELYSETGTVKDEPEDDLENFFQFLNAFYPDDDQPHDKAFWDDIREAWYEYAGATDEQIDWELWRELIGY